MVSLGFRRPMSAAFVLALVAAMVLPTAVFADTELGHRGRVGRHALRDRADRPGTACLYNDSGELVGVGVRPPRVFARDTTDSVDTQHVSWQFVVQRRANPDSDWLNFARSSSQHGRATDAEPAHFARMAMRLNTPEGDDPFLTEYRIVVRMLWWRGDEVRGGARHLVDWYRWLGVDTMDVGPGGACASEWVIF